MEINQKIEAIDSILNLYKADLGPYYEAYKNHVYRVYHLAIPFVSTAKDIQTLSIASAFHDLGIWTAKTFDYIEPSVHLAKQYAIQNKLNLSQLTEIEACIRLHHQITKIKNSVLAEIFRTADLVDLSSGLLKCGREKKYIKMLRNTFPNKKFHKFLSKLFFKNLVKNPFKPLPMYKW